MTAKIVVTVETEDAITDDAGWDCEAAVVETLEEYKFKVISQTFKIEDQG